MILLSLFLAFPLQAPAADAINLEPLVVIAHLENSQKITHLIALALVDYNQTVATVVKQPEQFFEMNPVLGKHPGRTALALFGIAGVAATALVSGIDHPVAEIVVNSIIATEQLNVWENQYVMGSRNTLPIMIVASFPF
jgi:hypothetical protein